MEAHSSILAWRIPRTKEPGRLQSIVSHRVGHDKVTTCIGIHKHIHYVLFVTVLRLGES